MVDARRRGAVAIRRRPLGPRLLGLLSNRSGQEEVAPVLEGEGGEDEIQRWLVGQVAAELELDPGEIDVTIPLERYGLDSRAAVTLAGDLEDWLGRPVPATLVWDYPTIEEISEHLKDA
jgi:acyl carrier protein